MVKILGLDVEISSDTPENNKGVILHGGCLDGRCAGIGEILEAVTGRGARRGGESRAVVRGRHAAL